MHRQNFQDTVSKTTFLRWIHILIKKKITLIFHLIHPETKICCGFHHKYNIKVIKATPKRILPPEVSENPNYSPHKFSVYTMHTNTYLTVIGKYCLKSVPQIINIKTKKKKIHINAANLQTVVV